VTATAARPSWGCPGSATVAPYSTSEADWKAHRMQGVGGSEIGVLLGHTPRAWQTKHGLWLIKTGLVADDRTSGLMKRGAEIEPIILNAFTEKTGLAVRRLGLQQSKRNPRMLLSPDAIAEDGAVVEAKLVSRYGRGKWDDGVPLMYEWQVRHALAVTGKSKGYLIAKDADTWEDDVYEFEARVGDFEQLSAVVDEFWSHVESLTPPPIDYATVDGDELAARFPIVDPDSTAEAAIPELVLSDVERLRVVKDTLRSLTDEKDEIETRLKGQIGDREYLTVNDRPVARWKQIKGRSAFDRKRFKNDHPGLEKIYTVEGLPSRRFELTN
jgi:putative phage-type endonuclease